MVLSSLVGMLVLAQAGPPQKSLFHAMSGPWTGYLEYKDYAGPGRVRIAVLFRLSPAQDSRTAKLRFVYDEGPSKILEESQTVRLDAEKAAYTMNVGPNEQTYRAEGLDKLRPDGTGSVRLFGQGTSNDKPVEVRMTLTVGPDRLTMLRETRKAPNEPYVFGSKYELVRVRQPK